MLFRAILDSMPNENKQALELTLATDLFVDFADQHIKVFKDQLFSLDTESATFKQEYQQKQSCIVAWTELRELAVEAIRKYNLPSQLNKN